MSTGNINFTKAFKRQGIVPGHLYKATVVDNDDPEQVGRVQCRVSDLFGDIEDQDLPWAIPRYFHWHGAHDTSTGSCGSGAFSAPAIGSIVFLVWQSPDPHHPTYQSYTVDKKTMMPEALVDYPHTHILFRFLNGPILKVNTRLNILYLQGSGDLEVRIEGDSKITTKGETHIATESAFIDATKSVNILAGVETLITSESDIHVKSTTGSVYIDAAVDLFLSSTEKTSLFSVGDLTLKSEGNILFDAGNKVRFANAEIDGIITEAIAIKPGEVEIDEVDLEPPEVKSAEPAIQATEPPPCPAEDEQESEDEEGLIEGSGTPPENPEGV